MTMEHPQKQTIISNLNISEQTFDQIWPKMSESEQTELILYALKYQKSIERGIEC